MAVQATLSNLGRQEKAGNEGNMLCLTASLCGGSQSHRIGEFDAPCCYQNEPREIQTEADTLFFCVV